ncbi:MAG: Gfo/Idh/MocA family oxidoreductase [Propionibacteriaceae bacterium]|nr:Gfo/Idh/MocA family oxidoreductase [Propionibacteriaceae bacterium]
MRVAVIGGGTIGSVHADSYRVAGAQVVAVVEPNRQTADAFARTHGATVYADLASLLASADRPEAISVCTPPATHRELSIAALEAGIHVLCEKPMAHSLEDAQAIHRAAGSAGAVFGVAYCHRFQPEIEFLRDQIEQGRIGVPRTFRNEFSGQQDDIERRWFGQRALAGGGSLLDAGIHSIDLFRNLCGEVVDAAGTFTADLEGELLEVEHTGSISVRSDRQVVGVIECSWKSPTGQAFVRVAGSGGSLEYDYFQPGVVRFVDAAGVAEELTVPDTGPRFDRQIRSFLDVAAAGGRHRTTSWDGLMGVAVVDAVYQRSAVTLPSGDGA